MCIPAAEVCDGKPQCQDQSDERDCWIKTKSCEHRCGKRCIPNTFLCDGEKDCLDGSDEAGCGDFMCSDRRMCLPKSEVCDGRAHCPDGSDEMQCQSEDPIAPCN
ncbi:hypothetical protein F7725_015357 [Dissostichus mawsoni]|uniref:Uncharacterized protein n=1 Tax=Dissostichus mawsoni TaxID=36200 RepID=A0A7J5YHK0_DISMA|nr:hypothetical protein F7725_015357 [Dissostichus mawsoni]